MVGQSNPVLTIFIHVGEGLESIVGVAGELERTCVLEDANGVQRCLVCG